MYSYVYIYTYCYIDYCQVAGVTPESMIKAGMEVKAWSPVVRFPDLLFCYILSLPRGKPSRAFALPAFTTLALCDF